MIQRLIVLKIMLVCQKEIATDDPDSNARYIGANPNNYVSFNDELWRIIGVMNNIEDGTGNKETRLKIIRDESIGVYSWDYDGTAGSNRYDNDWTTSTLMNLLNNGAYYNRTIGNYYNNSTTAISVDFTSNGLTSEAKSMIGNAVWNLGGSSTDNDVTASMFYERERGDSVYNGRPTEWIGQIGLMYPSDYGYATSGGSTTNRSSCLSYNLSNWDSVSDCYNNDWLYSGTYQWTLTPYSRNSLGVYIAYSYGHVSYSGVYFTSTAVSPALYLSSNVRISGGSGQESDLFTLSL